MNKNGLNRALLDNWILPCLFPCGVPSWAPSWVIILALLLSLCRMSELERARVAVTKIQVASSGAHNVVQPITKYSKNIADGE